MPPRPAVPSAAFGLIAAILAGQAILRSQDRWGEVASALAAACLVLIALGLALYLKGPKEFGSTIAIASLACLLSCASSGVAAASTLRSAEVLESSAVSAWSFEVVSDMSHGATSWRGRAKALGPDGERATVWLSYSQELGRGETVRGVGRFKPNDSDEWGRSSSGQGVCGTVTLLRVKQRSEAQGAYGAILGFREAVIDAFCAGDESDEPGAVLAGLVCGYSAYAKKLGLSDDFAACGASHLIAVSGSHLALISSLMAGLIKKSRINRFVKVGVLVIATGVFVVFCGSPLSAVRSWLMSIAAGAAELSGRRGHPLSAMSLMGCLIVLVDPSSTGQMGFILSVLCVAGICLFGKYCEHRLICLTAIRDCPFRAPEWARPHIRNIKSYVYQAVSTTLVCQVVSAPVCLPAYGKLSLVAPLANVFLGALFTPLLGVGAVSGFAASETRMGALGWPAELLSGAFIAALRFFARFPFACVAVDADPMALWLLLLAGATFVLVVWPEISRGACAVVLSSLGAIAFAYVIRWRWFAPASICVMNVGQADAILVRDGPASLMVDSGVDSEVAAALARNHVTHLDAIVLTHLDDDHVGGLDDLVGLVDCGRVYVASGVAKAMSDELREAVRAISGEEPVEIDYGETLRVGAYSARMVWPREPVDGDENADSVVLDVRYSNSGESLEALLTGDAEDDQLKQIIADAEVGDIDFLKVGHHGSAASIKTEEAAVLQPEVSVASAGENNRYKHPRQECIDALECVGSKFLCTKDAGDVTVRPGSNGPQVICQNSSLTTE